MFSLAPSSVLQKFLTKDNFENCVDLIFNVLMRRTGDHASTKDTQLVACMDLLEQLVESVPTGLWSSLDGLDQKVNGWMSHASKSSGGLGQVSQASYVPLFCIITLKKDWVDDTR